MYFIYESLHSSTSLSCLLSWGQFNSYHLYLQKVLRQRPLKGIAFIMTASIVNTHPYPFSFQNAVAPKSTTGKPGTSKDVTLNLPNVRGRIPSLQASRLRTMMLEAHKDPTKILAHCCSMDGLSSRLVEEAGFPMVFLAGYPCASTYG